MKAKEKPRRTRTALQLPSELDEFFQDQAKRQLTSKSAIMREALQQYKQKRMA